MVAFFSSTHKNAEAVLGHFYNANFLFSKEHLKQSPQFSLGVFTREGQGGTKFVGIFGYFFLVDELFHIFLAKLSSGIHINN